MLTDNFTPIAFAETNLFKPITVGETKLPHRVVMAPLTRMRATSPGNVPNKKWTEEYYSQRSQRPGTMIITESVSVSPQGAGYDNAPGTWSEEQVTEWTRIFKKVHDNKSFIWGQLIYLGRQASIKSMTRDGLKYVSASNGVYKSREDKEEALRCNNPQHGLTLDEIKTVVQDYVTAAKNMMRAGADGVEIHAAHGYLLGQFQDPISNQRTDDYGGSIANRSRLTLEIVDAVSSAIGATHVGIRFSPYNTYGTMSGSADPTLLSTFAYMIGELEKRRLAGDALAYVHMTEPLLNDNSVGPKKLSPHRDYPEGNNDFVYSIWKGPIIRTGELGDKPEVAMNILKDKRTLLGYGRYFISTPDLVDRLEQGLPFNKYKRDLFYAMTDKGYTDYPTYQEATK